jgi:hydroxypyruvate reductase/glycerate 2-kinase
MIHPAKMVHLFGVGTTPPGGKEKNPEPTDYENLIKHNDWLHTISIRCNAQRALDVIKKWDVEGKMPKPIVDFLTNFDPAKEAVMWQEFLTYDFRLFGVMPRKRTTVNQGMKRAEELGYTPYFLGSIGTEAAPSGKYMAKMAVAAEAGVSPFKPPCALFTSGELLVTCGSSPGVGGRNQEYCLAASEDIINSKRIVVAGVDTDGTDGPGGEFHPDATSKGITVLAGGIVDGYTYGECAEKGVDVHKALTTHATSGALWEVGSGIAAVQNISVGDYSCTIIMDHDG